MTDLKNCPFCGNEEISTEHINGVFIVSCEGCYATMKDYNAMSEAVSDWNTRAPHTEAQIEAAAQAMALKVNIGYGVSLDLTELAKAALKAAQDV